jgi:uncharacterized circularly permuted ATP-grasp superfamily protein
MESVLPQLQGSVIKPTWPGGEPRHASSRAGPTLSRRGLDEWAGRIVRQGDEHTVQAYLPLSQMPTWKPDPPAATTLRRARSCCACLP